MSKIDEILASQIKDICYEAQNNDRSFIPNIMFRYQFKIKSELLAVILEALPKEPKNWDEWGLERQMWFKLALDETTAALQALFGEEK